MSEQERMALERKHIVETDERCRCGHFLVSSDGSYFMSCAKGMSLCDWDCSYRTNKIPLMSL